MQSDLKPCAFCGWATGLSVFDGGDQPYWVECPDCCAQGSPEETKAGAIAAWNARASDAEMTRLTEALRAAEEREKGLREALGNIRALSAKRQGEGGTNETLTHIEGFARQALAGAKP